MSTTQSHRTFVSYIDKSREYYEAHGYEQPYRWPHYAGVPFSRPGQALRDCRVGIVTTADFAGRKGPRESKLFVCDTTTPEKLYTDKAWDREATHMDDPETFLPLARLAECAEQGLIASASPRFYGVPTDYSQRRTIEHDAPQIEAWMREDGVDVALLVPI